MSLHVHYLQPPDDPEALAQLRSELAGGINLTLGGELPAPETQILIAGRLRREQLGACPRLHSLIVPWAGIAPGLRDLLKEFPGIAVHNLHHNAAPVAELALALLLAAAKFIVPMDQALRRHDWRPRYRPSPALLLSGKSALILGYGNIGRRVAALCKALDMTVLAVRRHRQPAREGPADEVHGPDRLGELLPLAGALIICLPHTPETDGLLGRAELDLLPEGAVLVNIGRGAIVDEQALYLALSQGRLAAAGLDVWYHYPADEAARSHTPPSSFPFDRLDNVVLSPHRGGATRDTAPLRMRHLALLLNAAARGEPMPNGVDLDRGY
jgi:phosphoglycerate dehydrogenase-like enzyme